MSKKPLSTSEMSEEPENFENLYKSHAPSIHRFMFWRTQDEMLSEDLTSHVFEKAWRTRKNFKGGSSKAWLYRIAHTTIIDYWRKKKDLPADDFTISQVVSDTPRIDATLDLEMTIAAMQKAVAKLPEEMREVIDCRFIKGLSARETAIRLGMTEANVRVIQFRALKKLRSYLQ